MLGRRGETSKEDCKGSITPTPPFDSLASMTVLSSSPSLISLVLLSLFFWLFHFSCALSFGIIHSSVLFSLYLLSSGESHLILKILYLATYMWMIPKFRSLAQFCLQNSRSIYATVNRTCPRHSIGILNIAFQSGK